jgi:hypothetical protein
LVHDHSHEVSLLWKTYLGAVAILETAWIRELSLKWEPVASSAAFSKHRFL